MLSPNGFDDLQDFDDLPSVVSNDLISNVNDAASEASYVRQLKSEKEKSSVKIPAADMHYIGTPRNLNAEESKASGSTVHKTTPIVDRRPSNDFGSERMASARSR